MHWIQRLLDQYGAFIGLIIYMTIIVGAVIWFVTKTLGRLANKQQDESERDALRLETLSLRIDSQIQRIAAAEGAQRAIELVMKDDRDRWDKREQSWAKERDTMLARLAQLEMQSSQQQTTIDELKKNNENNKQEIETLTDERVALRAKTVLLEISNKALTDKLVPLEGRRDRLEAEARERDTLIADIQRKLTNCTEKKSVKDKTIPMPGKPAPKDDPKEISA